MMNQTKGKKRPRESSTDTEPEADQVLSSQDEVRISVNLLFSPVSSVRSPVRPSLPIIFICHRHLPFPFIALLLCGSHISKSGFVQFESSRVSKMNQNERKYWHLVYGMYGMNFTELNHDHDL